MLVRFAVDIYHLTPHEGLRGETPFVTWYRLNEDIEVHPAPDKTNFTSIFGILNTRKLTKDGLTVLGITYQSEELQAWCRQVGNVDMEIRIHADDVAHAVANFNAGWRRVTPTEDGYENVTALASRRRPGRRARCVSG